MINDSLSARPSIISSASSPIVTAPASFVAAAVHVDGKLKSYAVSPHLTLLGKFVPLSVRLRAIR